VIGDRWGVTDVEVARPYPCDDVVASPALVAWRGITIAGDLAQKVISRQTRAVIDEAGLRGVS
jgi:hypothetical protein